MVTMKGMSVHQQLHMRRSCGIAEGAIFTSPDKAIIQLAIGGGGGGGELSECH